MAIPTGRSPYTQRERVRVAALAANASGDNAAVVAPFDGTLAKATVAPDATITGAATNNRTHSVVNKGQSGAGAVVMASRSYGSGVNAPAYDETALTLSGTAANLDFVAGDVLSVQSTAVGTGIADPGTLFTLELVRA